MTDEELNARFDSFLAELQAEKAALRAEEERIFREQEAESERKMAEIEALCARAAGKSTGSTASEKTAASSSQYIFNADENRARIRSVMECFAETGKISISQIQIRLSKGYDFAAALMDYLKANKLIGADESGKLTVLLTAEQINALCPDEEYRGE